MQLILSWFENSLRPAYTDFHITQSILTDSNSCTGGCVVGEETEAALQQSLKSYFLSTLVWATASIVSSSDAQAELLSSHRPSRLALALPSPSLSILPISHRLFPRHFSYLTANPENA